METYWQMELKKRIEISKDQTVKYNGIVITENRDKQILQYLFASTNVLISI